MVSFFFKNETWPISPQQPPVFDILLTCLKLNTMLPEGEEMKPFLTGDEENKHKLKTRILENIPDLQLKTGQKVLTTKDDEGCVLIKPKDSTEQIPEQIVNTTVSDFGGDTEYYLGKAFQT